MVSIMSLWFFKMMIRLCSVFFAHFQTFFKSQVYPDQDLPVDLTLPNGY